MHCDVSRGIHGWLSARLHALRARSGPTNYPATATETFTTQWVKKGDIALLPISYQILTNFENSLTGTFASKSEVWWKLKLSLYRKFTNECICEVILKIDKHLMKLWRKLVISLFWVTVYYYSQQLSCWHTSVPKSLGWSQVAYKDSQRLLQRDFYTPKSRPLLAILTILTGVADLGDLVTLMIRWRQPSCHRHRTLTTNKQEETQTGGDPLDAQEPSDWEQLMRMCCVQPQNFRVHMAKKKGTDRETGIFGTKSSVWQCSARSLPPRRRRKGPELWADPSLMPSFWN